MKILDCGVAVIEGDTTHAVWIEQLGTIHHDVFTRDQVCRHIKPGDVVVQGGANIGTLTRAMLDAGAAVCAFEPNSEAAECLEHNCPRSLFGERVLLFNGALSDESGWCNLNIDPDNAGASWVRPVDAAYRGCIPRVALDDFTATKLSNIRLLLLDVEGSETRALRGAAQTIARCRPVIICEVNRGALERAGSSDAELLGLIEDMGYSVRILQPECKLGDDQFDIECLPR